MAVRYPGMALPGITDNGLGNLTQSALSGFDYGRGIRQEKKGNEAFGRYVDSLYGEPQQPQSTLAALADPMSFRAQPTVPTQGAEQVPAGNVQKRGGDYFSSVAQRESGGNPTAKNPRSSATGTYQFLESTWNGLAQQYPELGLTPDGRTDPAQQERAMRAFTRDNALTLQKAGIPVNPGNLYAAHFLGPSGATNVLKLPDDVPMSQAVGGEVLQANPHLANMTVGDFRAWTQKTGGNASGGYQAPQVQIASMQAPQGPQMPPKEVLMGLWQSGREGRQLAGQLIQEYRAGQQGPIFRTMQGPNGAIFQVNTQTGEQSVLMKPQERDKPPAAVQEYEYYVGQQQQAGQPALSFQEYEQSKKGGMSLSVDPSTGQVTFSQGGGAGLASADKFSTEMGKNNATMIKEAREQAAAAQDLMGMATQLETIMPELGYTGPGGDLYGRVDDLVGVLPGDKAARGAMKSLSTEAQLTFTEKTKGAITDREMGMFRQAVPNLSQTPEGNQAIVQVLKSGAERAVMRANFYEQWARSRGGDMTGAQAAWTKYMQDNPLISMDGGGLSVNPMVDPSPYLNPGQMPQSAPAPNSGQRLRFNPATGELE